MAVLDQETKRFLLAIVLVMFFTIWNIAVLAGFCYILYIGIG